MAAKRDRWLTLIGRRERWRDDLTRVRRLHAVVTDAEAILSGAKLEAQHQPVTNAAVQAQYAAWCTTLETRLECTEVDATERRCLAHFLHVTANMALRLFQCYDEPALPRTNNDLEGFIRSVKTSYRRVSGRKNWNRYLIRYGARVAFYEARARTGELDGLDEALRGVSTARWRQDRAEQQARQQKQIKQHRVRHRRTDLTFWPIWRRAGRRWLLGRDVCPDGFFRQMDVRLLAGVGGGLPHQASLPTPHVAHAGWSADGCPSPGQGCGRSGYRVAARASRHTSGVGLHSGDR